MNWNNIKNEHDLEEMNASSFTGKVVVLKHSTRCSISIAALNRVERKWEPENGNKFKWYFLDVIQDRALSNAIAVRYGIQHESPQVLVIENGKCIYSDSHYGVQYEEIIELQKN